MEERCYYWYIVYSTRDIFTAEVNFHYTVSDMNSPFEWFYAAKKRLAPTKIILVNYKKITEDEYHKLREANS